MVKNDHFFIKTKVYFDKGSMQMLRCLEGHCALVVSDSIMKELGYLQKAQKYLQEAGMLTLWRRAWMRTKLAMRMSWWPSAAAA